MVIDRSGTATRGRSGAPCPVKHICLVLDIAAQIGVLKVTSKGTGTSCKVQAKII